MLAAVEGTYEGIDGDGVLVRVGGVVFRVTVPLSVLPKLGSPGQKVRLHTHLAVKEDHLSLYGFLSREDLELFEHILGVSRLGSKVALALLSAFSAQELAQAIVLGREDLLAGVSGVGKKTASRLILELKEKLKKEAQEVALPGVEGEVVEALTALGFSATEARSAVASLPSTPLPVEEKVKLALQFLGRR